MSPRRLLIYFFICMLTLLLQGESVFASQQTAVVPIDSTEKILGADISFLPQLEARGMVFSDQGKTGDAIQLLKQRGFNYIRLRVFVNPAADSGYSPKKGFCDLAHTVAMAKRVKAAGMKFLLDFHYSDTWADPGKQFKPEAWKTLSFPELAKAVKSHTISVLQSLQDAQCFPDMIQVGNEINHGMLWPDGNSKNMDQLAELLKAGVAGIRSISPSVKIMMHIALGGQNKESVWFLDQLIAHQVEFDIIGQSYYPQWHGTIEELKNNTADLSKRYKQDLIIVEYTAHKKEVNEIAFGISGKKIMGSFIWEPLNTWEAVFDKDGKSNAYINEYDEIRKKIMPVTQ